MRLGKRITLLAAAIGVALLATGATGAWYVLRLQRLNSRVLGLNVSSIRVAEEIEALVREMRHELDRYLFTKDHVHIGHALEKQDQLDAHLRQALELSTSGREQSLVAEMQRGLKDVFNQLGNIVDMPSEPPHPSSIDSLVDDVLTDKVLANAHEYLTFNDRELQTSSQETRAMAERLALALILLGACGAIAGLVIGYGMARGISRSILQLSVPIRDVAGKLDDVVGPLDVSSDLSMGELELVLQKIATNVGAVVEQLHARHREVIRAEQLSAVGQLAAGLAHELRNPLMSMKILVQSAARPEGDVKLDSQDLKVLDEEISRLENLLQSFLDFARPATLERHVLDLGQVVRQTVEFLRARAARRNVTIDCRVAGEFTVEGDAAQLRQVVLNLLLNALDAVRNGGRIWVELRVEKAARAGQSAGEECQACACLRVLDDGCGLPTSDRDRICDPFFSTKETGIGLGLAISLRIVQAHGGELTASDREGGGAVFEIALPILTSDAGWKRVSSSI